MEKKQYEPFGPEWAAEMMRWSKKDLVDFFGRWGKDNAKLLRTATETVAERDTLQAELTTTRNELDALKGHSALQWKQLKEAFQALKQGEDEASRLKQENAELVEVLRESDLLMKEVADRLHVRGDFHNAAELQKARVAVDDMARNTTPEAREWPFGQDGERNSQFIVAGLPDPFAGLPGYEPKRPIFGTEEEGEEALRLHRANETKDEMLSRRLEKLLDRS